MTSGVGRCAGVRFAWQKAVIIEVRVHAPLEAAGVLCFQLHGLSGGNLRLFTAGAQIDIDMPSSLR